VLYYDFHYITIYTHNDLHFLFLKEYTKKEEYCKLHIFITRVRLTFFVGFCVLNIVMISKHNNGNEALNNTSKQ
jgi:hypothetical protein